jgi:hypothetical protein
VSYNNIHPHKPKTQNSSQSYNPSLCRKKSVKTSVNKKSGPLAWQPAFPRHWGTTGVWSRACARPGRPRLPRGEPRPFPLFCAPGWPAPCAPRPHEARRPVLADAGGVRGPSDPRGSPALSRLTSHVCHASRFSGGVAWRVLVVFPARAVVARWPGVADERTPRPCERGLGSGLESLPR